MFASGWANTALAADIGFEQAWQLMLQNNHGIAAEQANVQRYAQLAEGTKAMDLPSVTLGANYTRLDQDITLSGQQLLDSTDAALPPPAMLPPTIAPIVGSLLGTTSTIAEKDILSSSVRVIWPIFTGGRIDAAQRAARGRLDEAKSHQAMALQGRYDDLSRYYFTVQLAKAVLQTRQEVEQGLAQHLDAAKKLEQQGQIAKVERLQAQAAFDKAIVDRQKAAHDLTMAKAAFAKQINQQTGQQSNQQNELSPGDPLFINAHLPPLHAFIEQTLATYPGLSLLDAKDSQAHSLVDAEKGKYYPNVYLYGDYNLYEDDSLASQMKPDWLVGVGVSIPLIDNTGRSEQLQAAHSAVLQVRHLKAQAKQNLALLVQKTYLEAQQAIDEANGLNSSIALAKENILLRQTAFAQGLGDSLDVVDAQLYLASVQTQQLVARYRYVIALNKLLALSGQTAQFAQYQQSSVAHVAAH
ncbi:TolC family protein [Vibrio stylophorae]|nr:TolC family protein [Vibrio stylophorae]